MTFTDVVLEHKAKPSVKPTWQELSKLKRATGWHKIPPEWRITADTLDGHESRDLRPLCEKSGILSPLELEITNITSAPELANLIALGEVSAEQVTVAYCKRAAIAHQLTNCLTEIFFVEAIEAARRLDRQTTSKGPFHGIPFSLKDQFNVIGHDSTIGYIANVGAPAIKNSALVDTIIAQGGILYCKTNVPQTVLTADTVNNVFGRTLNPVNDAIIPGGSSGGEAALLACGGSVLGVGTDTGGSVRVPSAACELYGLKPSAGRVSYKDVVNSNDGNISVISVVGPMARDLDSLEFFMRHTLSTAPWLTDHDVLPLPWRSSLLVLPPPTTLTIGVMLHHGESFPPHPAFGRLLAALSANLRAIGVRVVTWESPELSTLHIKIAHVLAELCVSDGGRDIAAALAASGEPLLLAGMVDAANGKDVPAVWQLNVRARTLRQRYLALWRAASLDAVVCPTNGFGTLTPEAYAAKPHEIGYTGLWNLLDYAVVNLPLGALEPADLGAAERALGLAGFRVGCQVVCGRLEEERCLALARLVQSVAPA